MEQLARPSNSFIAKDTTKLTFDINFNDINVLFNELRPEIINMMTRNIRQSHKFRISLIIDFMKIDRNNEVERLNDHRVWGKLQKVNIGSDFNDELNIQIDKISEQLDKLEVKGSGWTINVIKQIKFEFYKLKVLKGGTYIKLPDKLGNKKACINVQNKDNKCFKWAILSCLYPAVKDPQRITKYIQYENSLNDENLTYPVDIKDVQKFATKNNLTINVFGWEKDVVTIYHTDKNIYTNDNKVVNLLLHRDHYVWVKNFSALMHDQTRDKLKKYTCLKCLNHHTTQENLDMHIQSCIQLHDGESVVKMPKPGSKTFFNSIKKMLKVPYVVYADFESVISPINKKKGENSTLKAEHVPSSYCLTCIRSDGERVYFKTVRKDTDGSWLSERTDNLMESFMADLNEIEVAIENTPSKDMIISKSEQNKFEKATHCYICRRIFDSEDKKVRDHDHITGEYRGPAHNKCNLQLRPSKNIPVILHNFRGYDSHLIIKCLDKDADVIANNQEKFMSMKIKPFRFTDSLQFLNASLDNLAKGLSKDDFKHVGDHPLLKKKGVFPYEYIDSFERYEETQLPSIDAFKSSLDGFKGISEEDYKHAQDVWETYGCRNLGDYSDLYLQTDVMLLADVFETFRNISLETYKLDPCHYISLPSLSWDALLLKTDIRLENISEVNMYNFIERGIRGGISTLGSLRYHNANNKYMGDKYDPSKPSSFIKYEDMNNLYGWAMKQPLPTHGFRWTKSIDDIGKGEGFIAEVDLEYPQHLHKEHNDLPFAPEHMTLDGDPTPKLIPNLNNKTKYVVHEKALKQMLKHGLKLTKIHNILAFKQSKWMEPYIDMNTDLRKKAKTDFEKDFYKLMNNAVFGKSMENVRNRIDVRLIADDDKYDKAKKSPRFRGDKFINEDLAAVLLTKKTCELNKPIYTGQSILDISKTLMYEYWYDHLKPKFGEAVRLMYTDTDSFVFKVDCEDYFETINYEDYDICNFTEPSKYYEDWEANKKRVGIPKSETGDQIIESFIALRSKMYSVKCLDGGEMNKAKGVKKFIVKKTRHEEYHDCLFNNTTHMCEQNLLRQDNHTIYNMTQKKVSLSNKDNKRNHITNIESVAHGYRGS